MTNKKNKLHSSEIDINDLSCDPSSDEPDAAAADAEETAPGEAGKDESTASVEERLEALRAESRDRYDRLLRVSAEFENYKKRSVREIAEFRKFANESFARELLTVLDDLERAATAKAENEDSDQCVIDGVRMILKGFTKTLERYGVKPILSVGEPFDPVFHQAVSQSETDQYPDGAVMEEFQKGYMIHDRLLRPAMVVIARGTSKRPAVDENA